MGKTFVLCAEKVFKLFILFKIYDFYRVRTPVILTTHLKK